MSTLAQLDPRSLQAELERPDPAPLLLDFWAEWCGTCRLQAPAVARLAAKHEGALRVAAVDVGSHPELGEEWDVQGLPTLLLLKGGAEVLRVTRFQGEAALSAAVAPHLDAAAGGERKQ